VLADPLLLSVGGECFYQALQVADLQFFENGASLVAVSDVLERFRGILAADIKEDLLSTTAHRALALSNQASQAGDNSRVLVNEARRVVDFVVNNEIQVLLRLVLGYLRISEFRHLGCRCAVG
jgi:hypothetical protein